MKVYTIYIVVQAHTIEHADQPEYNVEGNYTRLWIASIVDPGPSWRMSTTRYTAKSVLFTFEIREFVHMTKSSKIKLCVCMIKL